MTCLISILSNKADKILSSKYFVGSVSNFWLRRGDWLVSGVAEYSPCSAYTSSQPSASSSARAPALTLCRDPVLRNTWDWRPVIDKFVLPECFFGFSILILFPTTLKIRSEFFELNKSESSYRRFGKLSLHIWHSFS